MDGGRPAPKDATDHRDEAVLFGSTLMQHGFSMLPNVVLYNPDLSHGAVRLYACLMYRASQKGSCWPGQDRLAQELHVERKAVIRYLKELADAGLVRKQRRGRGRTNLYLLPFDVPKTVLLAAKSVLEQEEVPSMGQPEVPSMGQPEVPSMGHKQYKGELEKKNYTDVLPTTTQQEEVVGAVVRRVSQALGITLRSEDEDLLQARIKYFLTKKPDPDYVVSVAEECRAEYRANGKRVGNWVKLYLAFLDRRLEDMDAKATEMAARHGSEPSPASPERGTEFYTEALSPWLRYLSASSSLPARTVTDPSFEEIRPVSFDGSVLVLTKPVGFHSYNARAWPVTMQRVADERLGREITVVWEEEYGPTGEPAQTSPNGNRTGSHEEARGAVAKHART